MHFAVLAIVPEDGSVAEVLEPYRNSEWDFYLIGGLFTGLLDGYEPHHDPDNFETCTLCAGTGKRLELPAPVETSTLEDGHWVARLDHSRTTREYMESLGGCNGCHGKGTHPKPTSEWKPFVWA